MSLAESRSILDRLSVDAPEGEGRVRLDLSGPVGRLRLDNPEARNAITLRMMRDLLDAVEQIEAWQGAAIVLDSTTDGILCAGGHLGEVRASLDTPGLGRDMCRAMSAVLDHLLDQPAIVVAAVDGVAMGGGAELITACDYRVLARHASIHFVHARLGVAPGWGGTGRLVRHLGRRAALSLIARAEPISSEAALAIGLADRLTDGSAFEAALTLLAPILRHPVPAIRAIKGQVVATEGLPLAASRDRRADLFASVWQGPDHRAALESLAPTRGSRNT